MIFNNNEEEIPKNIDVCDLHYCAYAYIIFTFGMVGSLPSCYRLLNLYPQKSHSENDDIQMAIDNKKTFHALDIIDEAIRTGNWTNEASDELDNLIEIYNNGRNEITKILGRSLSETSRSSEAYATASIILGRVQNSMRGSNDSRSALEEFTARNRERAEQQIESWAKENGLWSNPKVMELIQKAGGDPYKHLHTVKPLIAVKLKKGGYL